LQQELYYTIEAENGRIGLAMIGDRLSDLILCDIDMPIMTGIDTISGYFGNKVTRDTLLNVKQVRQD
jgi:YesN/AraC family two-component response regulator